MGGLPSQERRCDDAPATVATTREVRFRQLRTCGRIAPGSNVPARSGQSGRSKFLQVLGNEHWAGKVLLHLVRPSRIIIVRLPCQMAQNHGLYSGARGYLPNILRVEMTFGHLSLDARWLLG